MLAVQQGATMTREWHNNEDAGDLNMQNAADASEFDDHCEDCGEHLEDCPCGTDPLDYPDEASVWADADALASAGMGTDEDYGYFGEDY